jgi:hypothetical protein
MGTWKTRFNGQAGIFLYIPIGVWNQNLAVCAGYSTYRGVTAGIGMPF